jgi:hypothetical protein
MDGKANRSIKEIDRRIGHHVKDAEWRMGTCVCFL